MRYRAAAKGQRSASVLALPTQGSLPACVGRADRSLANPGPRAPPTGGHAGIHSIQVSPRPVRLFVGSLAAPALPLPAIARANGSSAATFVFRVVSPGWISVDMSVLDPSSPIDAQIRLPGSGIFVRIAAWRGPTTPASLLAALPRGPFPPAPAFITTRNLWTAYSSIVSASASSPVLLTALSANLGVPGPRGLASLQFVAAAPGALKFGPGAFSTFLLQPTGLKAPGIRAVGAVVGSLEVTATNLRRTFKVGARRRPVGTSKPEPPEGVEICFT